MRAGSIVLGVACLALGAEGCTEPSFPEPEKDAKVEEADSGDDTPSTRFDAAPADDDAAQRGARDAVSASQPDGAANPSDAGAPEGAVQVAPVDAGADADAHVAARALPAWAEGLKGAYAKRSVTFSYDESLSTSGGNTRNVEYSIVTITENDGVLDVSTQLCDYTVGVESASVPPVSFKHATDVPPMTGRLVLDGPDRFSTEPMVLHLGFEPTRGNSCGASDRREKYAEQTWITGSSCTCSASALPTSINDCRVTDSDRDGKPGVTARGQYSFTPMLSDVSLVFDFSVTFVEGRVAANRRHELREERAQAAACVNASMDFCSVGNNELCPGGSARLIPLTAGATCAELDKGAFGPPDPFPAQVDCRPGR